MDIVDFDPRAIESNVTSLRVAARPNPKALLAEYLDRVYPSRRHGATDCGEYLADGGALSDADHMMQWLNERGVMLVGTKQGRGS